MNTKFSDLVVERLRAERSRMGLSQAEIAELGGVKPRTYQNWELGIASVATDFLMAMAAHGRDVVYVLTGRREAKVATLSPEESALLDDYRAATQQGRAAARAVLQTVTTASRTGTRG
jgi:transcriptional regulator with XRE-family HTH domain